MSDQLPGLHGRERTAALMERHMAKRKPLISKALWAALGACSKLRPIMQAQTSRDVPANKRPGIDWPELAPLTGDERTLLFRELRKIWQLPQDPRLRLSTEDGPVRGGNKPDLARPE